LQQQAFTGAQNMRASPQTQQATDIAGLASQAALNYGTYTPGAFSAYATQNPNLNYYQAGPVSSVSSGTLSTPTMSTAQSSYDPRIQQYQMAPSQGITTDSFTRPSTQDQYMSPYMRNVVERQQQDAARQSAIAGQIQDAQAARSGAFGGSGNYLMRGQMAGNLARQKGDIFAQGQQAAFTQGQQQFNQEQAARMQANLANQQAGLQVGGQNLSALLSTQQLATQTGLQTALANLSAAQQANVQNQAAHLQTQGLNAQQALQAALANQQAELGLGSQNLQAKLGVQQFGAGQDLQSQMANQQQLMQAQQLAEQSRQYGAGLGLQGLQTALTGAGQLGTLGQTQYGQNMGIGANAGDHGDQATQDITNANGQHHHGKSRLTQDGVDHGALNHIARGGHGPHAGQHRDPKRVSPKPHHQQAKEGTEHHQLALGKADGLGGFVDQHKTQRDQSINATLRDAADDQLNKLHFRCLLHKWDVTKPMTMPNFGLQLSEGKPETKVPTSDLSDSSRGFVENNL
jgi:hypothetical protein